MHTWSILVKTSVPPPAVLILFALFPALSSAEELGAPPPLGKPAETVYRQRMPDGHIVYSDKPVKGGKVDDTISVEPPIKGNLWSTESGKPPAITPQPRHTAVTRVPSIPVPGKRRTLEDATADVIRAEMYLEDAKKRRDAGIEPLPGERTANQGGGTRLNEAYHARQQSLAQKVAEAQAMLKKALAERDALRRAR